MSYLLKIVWINDTVIPIFAIFCNLLLLWLTKTIKTKTLLHINYSLIPNSILDIIVSIFIFIVAPHVFQNDGKIVIIFGEILRSIYSNLAPHIVSMFTGLVVASMISITVSFYIRYLVICRNQTLNIKVMIFPYLILFVIFITVYLIFLWFYLESLDYGKYLQVIPITDFWKEEFGVFPLFISNEFFLAPFLCYCGYLMFLFTFAYSLIFYYSIQISKTMKSHVDSNSNSNVTKSLHKQIQRTLFIQAIGPSLITSVPLFLIFLKSLVKFESTEISILLSMSFPWVSLTNPIAAFIFIKPYKKKLKTIFIFASKSFHRNGITTKILPSTK